jgi:phosphatidylglycerophosphate synthase
MKMVYNVPNILSLYRLCSFPVVLFLALTQKENAFAWMICINLVTDIADGLIARAFHLETEIGARLDSIADIGTFILAFVGIYMFKWPDFEPHIFSFGTFFVLFLCCEILSLIKFGRFPSLHLYSWKIGGYIQGIFFFTLFVFGFYSPYYYFMVTWGILAFLEHISIQLLIPELRSNARGIYWILKERSDSSQLNTGIK